MKEIKTEYFFSKTVIILTAIFLLITIPFFILTAYVFYVMQLKVIMFFSLLVTLLLFITLFDFYKRIIFFLKKTPALILTKDELIDNINQQKFKWTDIKNISTKSIKVKNRVDYIAISLLNLDEYIGLVKSPYKRIILKISQKYFGGAFSIQPNIVKCNNIELLNTLIKYFRTKD